MLPLNGLTADQALHRLRPGQTMLIMAVAGCVGGYAVELAVGQGLRVIGTATAGYRSVVGDLSTHQFIPRDVELGPAVAKLAGPGGGAGVIDAAMVGRPAMDVVADNGGFVSLVASGEPEPARGIAVSTVWTQPDSGRLAELAAMASRGGLSPRIRAGYRIGGRGGSPALRAGTPGRPSRAEP
jgi:NADPH:quinone reductase